MVHALFELHNVNAIPSLGNNSLHTAAGCVIVSSVHTNTIVVQDTEIAPIVAAEVHLLTLYKVKNILRVFTAIKLLFHT